MSSKKIDSLKKMSRKKKILFIAVVLFVAVGAFRIVSNKLEDKTVVSSDVINIRVTTAAITTLENTSPLTGRLEPENEVTIIPKAMAEVTSVNVELGQKVSKGTVLFTLDQTQVAAVYNTAKASYLDAQTNLNRIQALYQEGAVPLQQYEQAKTTYTVARDNYTTASDNVSNFTVTSPIDGYVTSINVKVGDLAAQSAPAATIANVDKLEIETSISETVINKIKVGDKVDVLVSSVSDKPFSGTVTALSPAPAVGSLTYPMKVTLDNATTDVKPGMFAEVVITSDKTANVIALPSNSVLIKSGETLIATIQDKKVVFKPVEVGVDNGTLAEIKSGIKVGDIVVIEGQNYLDENSDIKIID